MEDGVVYALREDGALAVDDDIVANLPPQEFLFRQVEFDRGSADRHRVAGAWFLSRGRRDEGLALMRAAIALEPKETESYVTQLVLAGVSDEEIGEAMPRAAEPLLRFARYLLEVERADLAVEAYRAVVGIDPENVEAQRAVERMTLDD